jgi:hypothetical protein
MMWPTAIGLQEVETQVGHNGFFGGAEVEAIENASIVWLADMVSRKFRGFGSNLNQ